jgi:hypothetical protein
MKLRLNLLRFLGIWFWLALVILCRLCRMNWLDSKVHVLLFLRVFCLESQRRKYTITGSEVTLAELLGQLKCNVLDPLQCGK